MSRGNINEDFFDQNPEYTLLPEVKKLLETDKKNASKIMWSIYLIEDPQSMYFRIPRDERIAEVKREFYDIKIEKYKPLIDDYCRFVLTKEEWMLKIYLDEMEKMVNSLKQLDNSKIKELDQKIKIMSNINKIWDGLDKIKLKLKEQDLKTQMKANAKEGMREKRIRRTKKGGE